MKILFHCFKICLLFKVGKIQFKIFIKMQFTYLHAHSFKVPRSVFLLTFTEKPNFRIFSSPQILSWKWKRWFKNRAHRTWDCWEYRYVYIYIYGYRYFFFYFGFQFKEQSSRYLRCTGEIWVDSTTFNLI